MDKTNSGGQDKIAKPPSRWDPWCDAPDVPITADFASDAERAAAIAALYERLARVRHKYVDIELPSDEDWLR